MVSLNRTCDQFEIAELCIIEFLLNTQNSKVCFIAVRCFGAHRVAPVVGHRQERDQLDALGVGGQGYQMTNNCLIR